MLDEKGRVLNGFLKNKGFKIVVCTLLSKGALEKKGRVLISFKKNKGLKNS